jgi:hypothetical protein
MSKEQRPGGRSGIRRNRPKRLQESRGRMSYELRRGAGFSWVEIAVLTGSAPDAIRRLAWRYAKDAGAGWPIPAETVRLARLQMGQVSCFPDLSRHRGEPQPS